MEGFVQQRPDINSATESQAARADPIEPGDPSPAPTSVQDLVDHQGLASPDALAIVAGDRTLSYSELNAWSNRLAHLLCTAGVGAEVPVALFLERSPELAIAALGVLKAGGAYVPLDPSYPPSRVFMLLEDSDAKLVLTHSSLVSRIPAGKWQTIVLDTQATEIAEHPAVRPDIRCEPTQLAYVIFTSGSTGRPKGVEITHSNLRNLVRWHQHAFRLTPADRASMQASPGFDASVWELWPYLSVGASVHVVDEAVRTVPDRLRDWIVTTGITMSFLPTAMAECMIDLAWPSDAALRVLLTGADTLRRYPPAGLPFALVNNYGPTECTVVTTSGTIYPEDRVALPAIGRSIDNVQIYVVDEELKRAPDGSSGELLIGGAGVGRGYRNLPELTAEKFIADRLSGAEGGHLYRTGDLARVLPDGEIEFLGRMDDQIKIMGYRIEPGEITAALDRHPTIASSYVTACSSDSENKHLVAYVVPASNADLNPDALRQFLKDRLPDYMLPSTFVSIPSLPLTAHGKVDRNALPPPTVGILVDDSASQASPSEVEQWLERFLRGLLGVTHVNRDDNFFHLGGHSLMGAQLIAKVHQTFGVELSLRSLFDHPTLREIASEIEGLVHAKLAAMSDEEAWRRLGTSPPGIPA